MVLGTERAIREDTDTAKLLLPLMNGGKVPTSAKSTSCSLTRCLGKQGERRSLGRAVPAPPSLLALILGLWQLPEFSNTFPNLTVQLNHLEQFSNVSDYGIQEYAVPNN